MAIVAHDRLYISLVIAIDEFCRNPWFPLVFICVSIDRKRTTSMYWETLIMRGYKEERVAWGGTVCRIRDIAKPNYRTKFRNGKPNSAYFPYREPYKVKDLLRYDCGIFFDRVMKYWPSHLPGWVVGKSVCHFS